MYSQEEIGKRIKELRRKKNLSQSRIAETLFISQAAYSLIENAQNGISVEHIIKLSNLYQVTTDYILKGHKNLITMNRKNGFIPLVNVHAHAGFVKNISDEYFSNIEDWYRIPGFDPSKDQSLFEVDGDSMAPTVLEKDILICQLHKNLENILDGSAVVAIVEGKIMVKRIRKHSDGQYLVLESDNDNHEHHKPMLVKKAAIGKIWIIRGKLSSGLVPFHEMASKGKITSLEENLEMLKKEVYQMNKKLTALTSKR
ncbi:transcriptional regulator [Gramella sp. AN32]|nr:transcriptional regulator [Gramella sp. AN32]